MTTPTVLFELGNLALRFSFNFDYDEVLMICMGFAAAAYVVLDFRRDKRSDAHLMELLDRVSKVEQRQHSDDRLEERISGYAERIASLETKVDDLREAADDSEDG